MCPRASAMWAHGGRRRNAPNFAASDGHGADSFGQEAGGGWGPAAAERCRSSRVYKRVNRKKRQGGGPNKPYF